MTTYKTLEAAARAYGAAHRVEGTAGGWLRYKDSGVRLGVQGWTEYGKRLVGQGRIQPQDAEGNRLDRAKTAYGVRVMPYCRWGKQAVQYVITEPTARVPGAVAVDTRDGMVFFRDALGELFTAETAAEFAGQRNAGLKPEHRSYKVYRLVEA